MIFVVPSFNDAFRETLTTNHRSFTQTAPGCHTSYVIQLIRQFQASGSKFALHHTETDLMVKLSEDVKNRFLIHWSRMRDSQVCRPKTV